MAIVNADSSVGSIIAPPVIIWLQLLFGWRTAFTATGVLGLGWLILWRLFYETPERHPTITPEELAHLQHDEPPARKLG